MAMFVGLLCFKQEDDAKKVCYFMNAEAGEMNTATIKPPPRESKEKLRKEMSLKEMTFNEIENIIGLYHDAFGSSVSWLVWYFDDDTCLVIFRAGRR